MIKNSRFICFLCSFLFIMSGIVAIQYITVNGESNSYSANILYLTDKNIHQQNITYEKSKSEVQNYIFKKVNKISEKSISKNDLIWVDYDFLAKGSDEGNITIINNLLNSDYPIVFIKDNLTKKEIIDILDINANYQEVSNIGDSIEIGIKIEKVDDTYLFTNIYTDPNIKNNNAGRYQSLVFGSKHTKLKTKFTQEKSSQSAYLMEPTTGNFTVYNTNGAVFDRTDAKIAIVATSYKYNSNPISGGQNLFINAGDFTASVKYAGSVKYLYTYVNTPNGSTVTDYGPRDNAVVNAGQNTTISIAIPFGLGFQFTPDIKTVYRLDSGGPGSSYVQIKASKYNSLIGNVANATYGDILETVMPVAYKNTTKLCNGSYVFTLTGKYATYHEGIYLK